jgi:cytochrome c oxidase cbb3-type subunit I/II
MYWMRAIGGSLYIVGMFILAYNIIVTIRASKNNVTDELAEAPALQRVSSKRIMGEGWHTWLERKPVQLTILATVTILIGGIVQIIPTILVKSNIPTISSVKPYTPLELEGRDIYIREGCVSCHSQMIRPFRSEVERYGEYSKAGEFVYDHPFLWGSKRTGPDLAREGVGGKTVGGRPDSWHFKHMYDPQSISSGSIMPAYQWLIRNKLDISLTKAKMQAMVKLGVPYTEEDIANAFENMDLQAQKIEENLNQDPDLAYSIEEAKKDAQSTGIDFVEMRNREIVALIAYLQRLGTDIKVKDLEATTQN